MKQALNRTPEKAEEREGESMSSRMAQCQEIGIISCEMLRTTLNSSHYLEVIPSPQLSFQK